MKATLSRLLIEAAKADPKVIVLTGDHGYGLFKDFRRECPRQFLNCGIAEQNMIGVAAGLARQGFKPIVYALAAFMPCRTVEQIKLDLCYPNLPVILLGDGAGLVYSYLGPSHHACEDVALLRSLPNMRIYSPSHPAALETNMADGMQWRGPTYIRIGKSDLGDVPRYSEVTTGLRNADVLVFATGSMVHTAYKAAFDLARVRVQAMDCLKPVHPSFITKKAQGRALVVTLEEHSTMGGLGSAVAEALAEMPNAPRLLRLGVPDTFRHTAGTWEHQIRECGLDTESVVRRIQEALSE